QCVDLYRCLRQLSVQRLTPAEAVSLAAHACAHAELRTSPAAAESCGGDDSCRAGRARTLSHPRVRTGARGCRRGERAAPCVGPRRKGPAALRRRSRGPWRPETDTVAPADHPL